MGMEPIRRFIVRRPWTLAAVRLALLLVVALVLGACPGGDDKGGGY